MKPFKIIAAACASLLLTSCFLVPGKFDSELTVLKDGRFSYTYQGEIQAIGMSNLMEGAMEAEDQDFTGQCTDDAGEPRDCTPEETEQQRAANRAENQQMMAMFSTMAPGMNAGDEESIARFVEKLSKQKGWNSVVHKGNGVFEIDYRIDGRADRDFLFPLVEDMPMPVAFVTMVVRKDSTVRVSAPGFRNDGNSSNLGMMGAMASMGETEGDATEGDAPPAPPVVTLDGTFRIRTDGEILTNNTEEGPAIDGGMRVLAWRVTPAQTEAPQALIRF